jgi:hypothetical protein
MPPDATSAILSALAEVLAEVRALRADLAMHNQNQKTPRKVRMERRHARIRDLAKATGLGSTWSAAVTVLLILCGKSNAPDGQENNIEQLRRDPDCPKTPRSIWRIIEEKSLNN